MTDGLVERRKVKDYSVYAATHKAKLVLSRLRENSQRYRHLEEYIVQK